MCNYCGVQLPKEKINFRDTCTTCGKDLHSCVNCVFYQLGLHHDCKEPVAELVKEKTLMNFCEYFKPNYNGSSDAAGKKNDKSAFDKLFS